MTSNSCSWKVSSLSELATVQSGVGFPKKHQGNESGEYPVYKVGDISKAYLGSKGKLDKAANYVSSETAAVLKGKVFEEDTILFAKIGEALNLNRRVIVKRKGLADNNVMGVIPSDKVEPRYLYRFLQFFDIASLSRSTTVPSIRKSDVEMIDVPHPDKQEQKRIADKLDTIFEKLEMAQSRLDKVPQLLKRFRMSVLSAAVSGELTEEWRNEHDAPAWTDIKVSDLVEKIEAGKNIKCQERPPQGDELGIVKISAVTWGTYDEEESKTLTDKELFLENRRIQVGDFLISRANTLELLGNPVIVHQVTKNLMLSDKVWRVVAYAENKQWLSIFLRSPEGRKQIESRATGNQESMRNIAQKAFMDIDLPLPDREEKVVIVSRVSELFEKADLVEKQYHLAKQRIDRLTQSILAKAFRGELFAATDN